MSRRGSIATFAVLVAAIALGIYAGTAALSQPPPSAGPSLALASPPTPRPTPNPSPTTAPDGLSVFPLGPIPTDSRIIVTGDPGDERLLLLDVANKRVRLLGHFSGFGNYKDARLIELTTNSSGDLLVVCLHADGPLARLYFIRPSGGDVRSFTIPNSENPRLSPDGATLAVSRNTIADQKGLWLLSTSDGTGRRITTDAGRRATRAIQWSADGTRLSALIDHLDLTRELVIVGVDGSVSAPLGPATDARWRGEDLVFWNNALPGPVSLYHAGAVTVTYASPPDVRITRAELKPRSKDLVLGQSTSTTIPKIVLYDSTAGTTSVVFPDSTWVLSFWWSTDATRLYAWILDNDTSHIRDAITGEAILDFCFRAKVDPPCGG